MTLSTLMTDLTSTDSRKSLIRTLQLKGYSGSDGTMVGEKSWLVRLSPLCQYSGPAVLLKSERLSILWQRIRQISPHAQGLPAPRLEVLAVPWSPVQPPISSSSLTYLSINQKQKQNRLNCFSSSFTQQLACNLFPTTELYN